MPRPPRQRGAGQPVTVGATAIIASAGLFVGIERGYFSQQGLDVQTTIVANSNDTLPLVATGKMDVANNAVTAFMVNAVNDGVNMKWVAGQASYTHEAWHARTGRAQGAVRQRPGARV